MKDASLIDLNVFTIIANYMLWDIVPNWCNNNKEYVCDQISRIMNRFQTIIIFVIETKL